MLAQLTRAWFGDRKNKSSTFSEKLNSKEMRTPVSKSLAIWTFVCWTENRWHTKKVDGWFLKPPRTSAATTIYWVPFAGGDSSPGREVSLFHVVYKETRLSDRVKGEPEFKSSSFRALAFNDNWVHVLNHLVWFYDFEWRSWEPRGDAPGILTGWGTKQTGVFPPYDMLWKKGSNISVFENHIVCYICHPSYACVCLCVCMSIYVHIYICLCCICVYIRSGIY